MKKEFYEKLLPQDGVYCVAGISKEGKITTKFAENLNDVFALTDKIKDEGLNVYVTPNTFSGYSRQGKYGLYGKSLFIDLDVGDDPKKYKSQDAALQGLADFIAKTGLPAPVRINSGTGIQAYWILNKQVSAERWKDLSSSFKKFCVDNGLKIDPLVTADIARLMRCPDTYNHRHNPPKLTSVLDTQIHTYDVEIIEAKINKSTLPNSAFEQVNNPVQASNDILNELKKGRPGPDLPLMDADTAAIAKLNKVNYGDIDSYFADIAYKSISGEGCNQLKRLLLSPEKQTYPEWFWGLSIAAHCTDGEEAIHDFSSGHPSYNHDDTIRKANETLKIDSPQRCETMEAINPEGCKGCPYKGKIGSPKSLGNRVKPLSAAFDRPKDMPDLPDELAPYSWSDGGIWCTPPPERGKDGKVIHANPFLLCPVIFYPTNRVYSKIEKSCLIIRALLPKDREREFYIQTRCLGSPDKLRDELSQYDILPTVVIPHYFNRMVDYMNKWNTYLMNLKEAENMHMQMGWTDDLSSFVVGDREVSKKGIAKAISSPAVRMIAKMLEPKGTLEGWQKSANELSATPGLELIQFGLMCGFGSPLMEFTNTPGVSVCFTGNAGNGKSGSLYAGLSIWGDPQTIAPQENGATDNGLVGRYLNLKNILMGVDEVHNMKPADLSKLVFQISGGKPKIRMQSSVNAERQTEARAKLICMLNSNMDLHSFIKTNKGNPEGEFSRLVQFYFPQPKIFADQPHRAREIIHPFNENYGHAGPIYMKAIFDLGFDHVKSRIEHWGKKFDKVYKAKTVDRFYRSLIATTFCGTEIANSIGLTNFNLEDLFVYIVGLMIDERDETKGREVDYEDVYRTFLNQHIGNFLKVDAGNRIVDKPASYKELVGRKEIHTKRVMIHKDTLRKWIIGDKNKLNMQQFELQMVARGILLDPSKKVRLGVGWEDNGSVNCMVFEMDSDDESTN